MNLIIKLKIWCLHRFSVVILNRYEANSLPKIIKKHINWFIFDPNKY